MRRTPQRLDRLPRKTPNDQRNTLDNSQTPSPAQYVKAYIPTIRGLINPQDILAA